MPRIARDHSHGITEWWREDLGWVSDEKDASILPLRTAVLRVVVLQTKALQATDRGGLRQVPRLVSEDS